MEIRITPDGFRVKVFFSKEDECFIADVIDFRYCSAHGHCADEAMKELLIAKQLWLDSAREKGFPLPLPLGEPPPHLWNPLAANTHRASTLALATVPSSPGIYAWFFGDELIYIGTASNLRRRLRNHLSQSRDLSRSAFRRNVAEFIGVASVKLCRIRPSQLVDSQTAVVNQWIMGCDVIWARADTAEMAQRDEELLIQFFSPRLNRK